MPVGGDPTVSDGAGSFHTKGVAKLWRALGEREGLGASTPYAGKPASPASLNGKGYFAHGQTDLRDMKDLYAFISLLVEMATYRGNAPPNAVQRKAAAEAVARFDAERGVSR